MTSLSGGAKHPTTRRGDDYCYDGYYYYCHHCYYYCYCCYYYHCRYYYCYCCYNYHCYSYYYYHYYCYYQRECYYYYNYYYYYYCCYYYCYYYYYDDYYYHCYYYCDYYNCYYNKAQLAVFDEIMVTESLTMLDGSEFCWELADPNLLLARFVTECPPMRVLYLRALRDHPPPWRLVICFDEFVPGNKFKVDNGRKLMDLSFSFLELGSQALSNASMWITPMVIRHCKLAESAGGWSHCLARFLQRQLLSRTGLQRVGVPLILGGEAFVLHARSSCHYYCNCHHYDYNQQQW